MVVWENDELKTVRGRGRYVNKPPCNADFWDSQHKRNELAEPTAGRAQSSRNRTRPSSRIGVSRSIGTRVNRLRSRADQRRHQALPRERGRAHWSVWPTWPALWVGMVVCVPTYTLAGGLVDQGGMNWWQAVAHHHARQRHRAGPHGAQRPCRHQVRRPLPRARPGQLRHLRRTHPQPAARPGGVRAGSASRPGSAASPSTSCSTPCSARWTTAASWSWGRTDLIADKDQPGLKEIESGGLERRARPGRPQLHLRHRAGGRSSCPSSAEFACFLLFWALQIAIIYWASSPSGWLETLAAPFLIGIGPGPAGVGLRDGRRLLGPMLDMPSAFGRGRRASEGRVLLGLRSVA